MNMDFTLFELFDRPGETFNAYYNGWNNESNLCDDGTVIHHPRADIKKLCLILKTRNHENKENNSVVNAFSNDYNL